MIGVNLVVWLILGASSDATVVIQADKGVISEQPDDSSVQLLYIRDRAGLLQVASSKYGVTADFEQGAEAIAVDYHYPLDLLFWSTSRGQIWRSPLKQSRKLAHVQPVKLVYAESRWYPQSIALDYLNDKLYVLDSQSNTIRVLNLDGGAQTLLSVGQRNYRPKQIEIDPGAGYLFLLDEGEPSSGRYVHVLRMKLDGTEPKVIDPAPVHLELITAAMTLDRARARLLLSSRSQRKIIAADYEGKLVDTVLEPQNGSLGMSLGSNELFWINAAYYNKGAAFTDGSVYKCDLEAQSGRCLANSTRKLHEALGPCYVRAVRAVSPPPALGQQPAADGCNCFSKARSSCLGGSECACEIGYGQARGGRDGPCRPVERFVIYEEAKVVRSLCLPWVAAEAGSGARCQAFAPFRAELRLRRQERAGFEYDPLARQLYYGGKNAIYRADLDSGNSSLLLYQRAVFYGPMALDWASKNLYYTEIEQRGNVSFYMLKLLAARPRVDAEKSSSMLWELGRVHTMAVCPWRGYLFLSVYHNQAKRFQMRRLNLDGSNMTLLLGLNDTTFFSIDHAKERIYSVNANTSMILRSDYKGHRLQNLTRLPDDIRQMSGFLVDDQFIYLQYRSRLLRLDKRTGKSLGDLDLQPYDTHMSAGLRLHAPDTFQVSHQNACAINNGACDNFCFAVPQSNGQSLAKLCRCFDGVRCFGDTRSGLPAAHISKHKI